MNNIAISDSHLKALRDEGTSRPDALSPATILSELLDLVFELKAEKGNTKIERVTDEKM